MYQLIFVDDESIIREGISSCIAWGELGFELAAMFENGQQAIDHISSHPVDVVLSDIKMPKVDGLELSKMISEQHPQVMVLLLSGYDDFEYAQEALKYHVNQFLLKPITAEELSSVLRNVKKSLDEQYQEQHYQQELQEKLARSFPLLRERFLYRLVSGRIERSDIADRTEYFQWNDLSGLYQILVLGIPESWDDLQRLAIAEHVKILISKQDEVLTNRDEHLVILLQNPLLNHDTIDEQQKYFSTRSEDVARRMFSFISRKGAEHIYIGCGEIVRDISRIAVSYRGASSAVDYLQVLGVSKVLHISEIRNKQTASPEDFNLLSSKLLERLKSGSRDDSDAALDEIFSYFERHYLTLHEASFYLIRLHAQLQDFAQEMNLLTEQDPSIPYQTDYFVSINQAKGFFSRVTHDMESRIASKRHDITVSRIDNAKAIIASRYNEKLFSLQDICDELYLSTSQFSVLFKEGTGKTFVEYLTGYRVDQAKALLKNTSLKAYEIAELVGFSDPRYFSIIFKKYANKTPMEYRRSLES